MSDFTGNFWHLFVAGITLVGMIACLILLWFSGKTKAMTANDNTTGHVWDGDLREMNNPLPRWWVGLFIITVVFSLVYLAFYPGLGTYAGKFGWSAHGQYESEVAKANAQVAPLYAKFQAMPVEDVAKDPQAMAIGDRLFMNNCAQCHGSDARGSKGFPNLTDADWLHGGSPEKIKETLVQGRNGMMPPWPLRWARPMMCATSPTMCSASRAAPTTACVRAWARPSSAPAQPATAWTAKATRPWARPT